MNNTIFPTVALGDLEPRSWVRLADGDVGVIHDRVDQPGYQKVCVEVPGHRYPMRILSLDTVAEHITDRNGRRVAEEHRFP